MIWEADQEYRAGGWGYIGGEPSKLAEVPNILGTEEDPLYQVSRTGMKAYRFDVPDGDYEVELAHAERFVKLPGQRVFSVSLNGKQVRSNLDLVREYGDLRAVAQKFQVKAERGRGIEIQFQATVGEQVVSAIRVTWLR